VFWNGNTETGMALGKIYALRPRYGDARNEFELALEAISLPASQTDDFTWTHDGKLLRVVSPELGVDAAVEIARACLGARDDDQAERFLALAMALADSARFGVVDDDRRIAVQDQHAAVYDTAIQLHTERAREQPESEHAVRVLHFVEAARSRALLDLLGTAPLSAPEAIPTELLHREQRCLDRLRQILATSRNAGNAPLWDEYEAVRHDLESAVELHGCHR
jgi:hypothetical protein